MENERRRQLLKQFMADTVMKHLCSNSLFMTNAEKHKFYYVSENEFMALTADICKSLDVYLEKPFWDKLDEPPETK